MQNDMRDRLVRLLRADMHTECDKHEDCLECPYQNDEDACYEHLATMCADHLIANGVIVLDMNVISPENRPLITHFATMPLDDVLELIEQKLKEMRVENGNL